MRPSISLGSPIISSYVNSAEHRVLPLLSLRGLFSCKMEKLTICGPKLMTCRSDGKWSPGGYQSAGLLMYICAMDDLLPNAKNYCGSHNRQWIKTTTKKTLSPPSVTTQCHHPVSPPSVTTQCHHPVSPPSVTGNIHAKFHQNQSKRLGDPRQNVHRHGDSILGLILFLNSLSMFS